MKQAEIVEQAGLKPNESLVYSVLLDLGNSSLAEIAVASKLHRPTVYQALGRLELLGLVNKFKVGKRFGYSPTHPRRLLEISKLRYKSVEDSFEKLVNSYNKVGQPPQSTITEGIESVYRIYFEAFERLKNGEELRIFTNIGRVSELFPEVPKKFEQILNSVVFKARVKELVFGDETGKEYAASINKKGRSNYEVKLLSQEFVMGDNEQFIFNDKIIYFSLQKQIFVVTIENADLAKTHATLFDAAWKNS